MLEKLITLLSGNVVLLKKSIEQSDSELKNRLDAIDKRSAEMSDQIAGGLSVVADSFGELAKAVKEQPPIEVKVPDVIVPEIKAPQVNIPEVKVTIPEIKIPEIKVPQVNVAAPQITVEPKIEVLPTPVVFPKEMSITGFVGAFKVLSDAIMGMAKPKEYTLEDPMPISFIDRNGKRYDLTHLGGGMNATGGGAPRAVRLENANEALINPAIAENQNKNFDSILNAWNNNSGHNGAQININYSEAVMHGAIPGASSFSSNGHYVWSGPGTTSNKPIGPGGEVNIAPDGGVQLTFVSTSAQDTNLTGTGVWTLAMGYIEDTTLLAKTEIITMNGLTPVTTVATNIRFVNTLTRLAPAGSALVPIGTITATAGGVLYGQIDPLHGVQASSFRMIPAGKVFYPQLIVASSNSGTAAAQTVFHIVQWSPSLPLFTPANAAGCQDSSIVIPLGTGRPIIAGSVIGLYFNTTKATEVTGSFIGYIENA